MRFRNFRQVGRKILAALVNFNSQGIELVGVVDNRQWPEKTRPETFLNGWMDGAAHNSRSLDTFHASCTKKIEGNNIEMKFCFSKIFCPSPILEWIRSRSNETKNFKRDLVSKISLDPRLQQIWLSIVYNFIRLSRLVLLYLSVSWWCIINLN